MASLEDIERRIESCRKCDLWKLRTKPVPGSGNPKARLMLIGEAPGYWEDQKGLPFVGRAGKLLDELLGSIGLSRNDVYITNIVKCRPPENRDPTEDEIRACAPYLDAQIDAIRPKVIAPLGRHSMRYVLMKFGFKPEPISRIHGKVFEARTLIGRIRIVPLYHPAAALYNPRLRDTLFEDFVRLRELLDAG